MVWEPKQIVSNQASLFPSSVTWWQHIDVDAYSLNVMNFAKAHFTGVVYRLEKLTTV